MNNLVFQSYFPIALVLGFILLLSSCKESVSYFKEGSMPPNHEVWSILLASFVSDEGEVDYPAFQAAKKDLEAYLRLLNQHPPDTATWSEAEQLAFWINAYNAFTIKLITDHYPLQSIQDLHPFPYIPLVRTIWHKDLFVINDIPISLDHIEHGILRRQFKEPRIHFAINCASKSCPPLLNQAYTPDELDALLEGAAWKFIGNPRYNQIDKKELRLSAIFNWFRSDFTEQGTLPSYLQSYTEIEIAADANIDYLPYDWSLNE